MMRIIAKPIDPAVRPDPDAARASLGDLVLGVESFR